ncbi:hypothetical protein [Streptacidiphilus rugosus]|uniref:hypothetical protein n=1 Tax=Streptacidiphilus rugosus TaxID=405783 RepID=UPI000569853A|nr:hypothetical protein [Streptacidiphilus rugosus]
MRIPPIVVLPATAALAVFGFVAYGSANSSHTSPAPIDTPTLSAEALKAVDAEVSRWDRGQGGHDLITLLNAVIKVGDDKTSDALYNDCAAVTSAATQLQHDAPIPDGPSQAHLTRALEDLLPGASQCGPGSNQGVEAMGSATYMINQGIQELQAVDKRMAILDAGR